MKREAGENPARTRHRDLRVLLNIHWETGKERRAFDQQSGDLPFTVRNGSFMSRGIDSTKQPMD